MYRELLMENFEFFDNLSSDYDEMINFRGSIENKLILLNEFISPNHKTALDLGCGTGADSIALTKLGLNVTSVDYSQGMMKKALSNADNFKIQLNFVRASLTEINFEDRKFDLIVSLGNTLANITKEELEILFEKFQYLINFKGKIIIQLVNYEKLPTSGKYLLNKYESESIIISREYEFHNGYIDFIISRRNNADGATSRIVTKIYPHSESDIKLLAAQNNFNVEIFGNLKRDLYLKKDSENLVAVLSK
jgi:SAM-dependent methyltransferase